MERKLGGNENELFVISTWKNQLDNDMGTMNQNLTRMEYKVDQTNSNVHNLEIKMKKQGTKLARLHRNYSRLEKIREEINSLKSQVSILENVN